EELDRGLKKAARRARRARLVAWLAWVVGVPVLTAAGAAAGALGYRAWVGPRAGGVAPATRAGYAREFYPILLDALDRDVADGKWAANWDGQYRGRMTRPGGV